MTALAFHKVTSLPGEPAANAFYFVENGTYAEAYLTDDEGTAKAIGNSSMITAVSSAAAVSESSVVADITARDALTPNTADLVYVVDASADSNVSSGAALYVYDGDSWERIAEFESLDFTVGAGSITATELASDAVTTAKINDGAVTTDKLGADAVTGAKIADDAVGSEHIADGAVDTAQLAAGAVETAKIADAQITTAKIVDANVTEAKLASNAVTTAKITDANVTTAKIADDAVTTAKINDGAVTLAKIAQLAEDGDNDLTFTPTAGSATKVGAWNTLNW